MSEYIQPKTRNYMIIINHGLVKYVEVAVMGFWDRPIIYDILLKQVKKNTKNFKVIGLLAETVKSNPSYQLRSNNIC
jgi:hypothetical protein